MAWSHPRTWSVSDLASAAILNAGLRDNLIALGTMTQGGTATFTVSAANTPTSFAVTFPVAFPSTPVVTLGVGSAAPQNIEAGVTAVTTTGCTLWGVRNSTGSVIIMWIATAGPYT